MRKTSITFAVFALFLGLWLRVLSAFGAEPVILVPNEQTAITIAVAVWTPIYGEALIQKQKPFRAELKGEIWFVYGSLPQGVTRGGTMEAEISRLDGKVTRVGHGR